VPGHYLQRWGNQRRHHLPGAPVLARSQKLIGVLQPLLIVLPGAIRLAGSPGRGNKSTEAKDARAQEEPAVNVEEMRMTAYKLHEQVSN
jgi:hypothetical protein